MRAVPIAFAFLCLIACVRQSPPLVCDLAKANTLVFGFEALNAESMNPLGYHVINENGVEHLFVDGACNYWLRPAGSNSADQWRPVRYGTLAAGELDEFNKEVQQPGEASESLEARLHALRRQAA